ncbi:hypothetical protein ACHHYP_03620 [Achlya hypogyna]|uniref:Uncharacterized protein n=1 Tax=Achlya hypogyna TaxID=1202772 RepID=A0A1V9ZR15_ACHHY|nr:hypothetical protein ACHHYP_03620 [Achlya hypogyna]
MEWSAREEELLRQCVFEQAYDFDKAAEALAMRLPKARLLVVRENINGAACEQKWKQLCDEEMDVNEGDDQDDGNDVVLKAYGNVQVDLATTDVSPTLRLELPLSETEIDALLSDIIVPHSPMTSPEHSEMQWVLSYLADPSNAIDEDDVDFQVDYAQLIGRSSSSDNDAYLTTLDLAFQQSRHKSQSNRSFDNIILTPPTTAPEDEVRTPSLPPPAPALAAVHEQNLYPPPEATPMMPAPRVHAVSELSKPQISAAESIQNERPAFLALPNSTGQPTDAASDSDADSALDIEDDWRQARQAMKKRAAPLQVARPPPNNTEAAPPTEAIDDHNAAERSERALRKHWQEALRQQESDAIEVQIRQAERDRVRRDIASLLLASAPLAAADGGHFQLAPPNPFELSNTLVSPTHTDPPVDQPPPLPVDQAPTPREYPALPLLSEPPKGDDDRASGSVDVKRLIEQSIAAGDLCEPLYHRQLSHARFIPLLPQAYWNRLFAYGNGEAESDVTLEHVHVLASILDVDDPVFGFLLEFVLSIEQRFVSTTLLGVVRTVATEPLDIVASLPPAQADQLARPVLYIALLTGDIDAVLAAPVAGASSSLGACCVAVQSPAVDTASHPLHLFTRLPAFEVFIPRRRTALPPTLPPETTVAVVAAAFDGVAALLAATASLDLVGCRLCFQAAFEADQTAPHEVATAPSLLVLALRGPRAVAALRDAVRALRDRVYASPGLLQARRDLVHWFGGRITTHGAALPAGLPRPRPLYTVVVPPEEVVVFVCAAALAPSCLGAAVDALASCGYMLSGAIRLPPGTLALTATKENGRRPQHVEAVTRALREATEVDVTSYTGDDDVVRWAARAKAVPLPAPDAAPPLFVDYEREQTLFAVVPPAAFCADGHALESPPLGRLLRGLLGEARPCHLLGLKLVVATPAIAAVLSSLAAAAKDAEFALPDGAPMLLVVFRQLIPDGNMKRALGNVPLKWIFVQPTVVNVLVQRFFSPAELHQTTMSALDACVPDHAVPGLQRRPTAPLVSLVVLKPAAVALLPVVLRRLARENFTLLAVHMAMLSPEQAAVIDLNGSSGLTAQPCVRPPAGRGLTVVCAVRRANAVSRLQALVGPADPAEARRTARLSLVAGFGSNGFFTPASYAATRCALDALFRPVADDEYDALATAKRPPALAESSRLAQMFVTPKTLVETTLVLLAGSLATACGRVLPWLVDDEGFRLVNVLATTQLSPAQRLPWAGRLTAAALDGLCVALALERDSAVSRMNRILQAPVLAKFMSTDESQVALDICWATSKSFKDAQDELVLFFHELHGSVHCMTL